MLKRIFSIIFAIFIIFTCFLSPLAISAFEVTGVDISAKAGMLVSLDTDEMLYENNIDKKVYPASITKIMTGILILENEKYNPQAKIAMTKEVLDMILGTGSSVSLMVEGEEITEEDLLYMVLMSSYGDSTLLAAIHYGGSVENFVAMMNAKAKELGLTGTHYSNPIGLHDENTYTTVRDICTLTKYALKNETFKTVCETSRHNVTTSRGSRTLSTTNLLQDKNTNYFYQYAKGVKTGFTDQAGYCLVSTASYNGYNYMCILMNCDKSTKRFTESANLYRWAFNNFSYKEIAKSDEPVCEMPVNLSMDTDFVPLYFKEPFVSVLPNEANDSTIVVKTHLKSESYDAPIKKGEVLGYAEVIYAEKVIGKVDLVAGNDVNPSGILVVANYIKNFFTSSFMKVLLIAVVIGIVIFIALCINLNLARLKKRRVRYIPYKDEPKNNHKK